MPGIAFRLRDDRLPFPALQQLASMVEQRGYETLFTPEGGGRDVFHNTRGICQRNAANSAVARDRERLHPHARRACCCSRHSGSTL